MEEHRDSMSLDFETRVANGEDPTIAADAVIRNSGYAEALLAERNSDSSLDSVLGKEVAKDQEQLESISENSFLAFEASLGS